MIQLKKIISTSISLIQPNSSVLRDASVQCPSPTKVSLKQVSSQKIGDINVDVLNYITQPTSFVNYRYSSMVETDIFEYSFKFPKPPAVNIHSEAVESKIAPFAREYELYKGMETLLDKCKFGWLPGFLDPYLSQLGMEGTAFYYVTLFAHDDAIDLYSSTGDVNPVPLARINNKIEKVMAGLELENESESDTRVIAIQDIYKEYYSPLIKENRYDFSFGLDSLHQYLQSTVLEAEYIHDDTPVSEGLYLHNRQHTGGIRHALSVLCLFENVDISKLLKKHLILDFMLRQVSDCVGILNDVFSFPKELKELKKKIISTGDTSKDSDLIKSKVTSNLVLIKWREGLSLSDSINYSIDKYDKILNDFYTNKEQLRHFFSDDEDLSKLMFIMEGWLFGHPAWSVNSGRYGSTTVLSNETASNFLDSLGQTKVEEK